MVPLVACKLVLRKEAFRSYPAQGPLVSGSEVHGVFSNKDLPSHLRGQPRAIAIVRVFAESLGQP